MSAMLIDAARKGDTRECQKLLAKSSIDPNMTDWVSKKCVGLHDLKIIVGLHV